MDKPKQAIRSLGKSSWLPFTCFYAFYVYEELLFRAFTAEAFFGSGLLSAFFFSAPYAILMGLVSSAFSPKVNRRVAIGLVAFPSVLFGSQLVYHHIFNNFYIVYSFLHSRQAISFWREAVRGVLECLPVLALQAVPLLLLIFWGRKRLPFTRVNLKGVLRQGIAGAASLGLAILMLLPFGTEQFSPFDLFLHSSDIIFSVRDLGLMTSMGNDLNRTIFGKSQEPLPPLEETDPPEVIYTDPPTTPPETTAPTTATQGETQPVPVDTSPNMLDIDFDAMIANETDPELLEMHQFFSALEPSAKNEKTGLFAGNNVIFIVAEGFSHYVIDPQLTPTLYKMQHQGYNFTNFYTPLWGVSTSDGEYVADQGLIPKSGVWSFYRSSENYLPFVLGRQLQGLGYSCNAYHNHTYTYYDRDLSHPNMGYNYKGLGAGLPVTETWPASDEEMIALTVDEYIHDQPFHAYYMTVSGHLNYSFEGNAMSAKNREAVEHLPYSDAVKAYLACNLELESAMTLLLERLEEAGVLDNTLIVISADHYPYGLEDEDLNELAGHELDRDFEIYRNALIIYRAGMEPETIDEPCCSMDILPTVSNLLGLDYDSRLLMGRDVFSDAEPLVVFSNRSFITRDASYSTRTRTLTPNEGVILPEDYREFWSEVINRLFKYSAGILDYDYYGLLFPEAAAEAVTIPCVPDQEE